MRARLRSVDIPNLIDLEPVSAEMLFRFVQVNKALLWTRGGVFSEEVRCSFCRRSAVLVCLVLGCVLATSTELVSLRSRLHPIHFRPYFSLPRKLADFPFAPLIPLAHSTGHEGGNDVDPNERTSRLTGPGFCARKAIPRQSASTRCEAASKEKSCVWL